MLRLLIIALAQVQLVSNVDLLLRCMSCSKVWPVTMYAPDFMFRKWELVCDNCNTQPPDPVFYKANYKIWPMNIPGLELASDVDIQIECKKCGWKSTATMQAPDCHIAMEQLLCPNPKHIEDRVDDAIMEFLRNDMKRATTNFNMLLDKTGGHDIDIL